MKHCPHFQPCEFPFDNAEYDGGEHDLYRPAGADDWSYADIGPEDPDAWKDME